MTTGQNYWSSMRTWIGSGRKTREVSDQPDDLQRLSDILRKAEAFDARARKATLDSGIGLRIGDEVVIDAAQFPRRGRIIDTAVMDGKETFNIL